MSIEQKLKEFILSRYKSIREFITEIDMPYTTIDSMFRRGIENSSVAIVVKVCKGLGISADALADGEIVPINSINSRPKNNSIEITDVLVDTKDLLHNVSKITLDGDTINKAEVDYIFDSMDVVIEVAKRRNK